LLFQLAINQHGSVKKKQVSLFISFCLMAINAPYTTAITPKQLLP